MSNPNNPISFSDFPEEIQLCILSFLTLSDLSSFASTSKSLLFLCRSDSKLWFSLCHRRWSSKTQITKWAHNPQITFRQLYKTLIEYETLIGFWRRSGITTANSSPPLVVFEWGPSFITGSRLSPSSETGTYSVTKSPFLWLSVMPDGAPICIADPDCKFELCNDDLVKSAELGLLENELVPVNVSFMGKSHMVVEENLGFGYWNLGEGKRMSGGFRRVSSSGNLREEECGVVEDVGGSPGSLPDRLVSEIYQYFANRTSPGGDRRRQRRKEKERQGRRKWEAEHFVKIVNCSPTPSRPLQGLWKGISDDKNLDFYLVVYDDVGGIACRRVGDSSQQFSNYSPVFWTSNATFIESPFSPEEEYLYDSRMHLRPPAAAEWMDSEVVSRILFINSSYDLVIPNLVKGSGNPRQVEGRIWQYRNGTFGFGFLRNNYIIDLKHIAHNGCILDTRKPCID